MNWLLLSVVVLLAGCMVAGYWKGFLRIAYSLVAWILIFVFVTWSKPYINDFLRTQTTIYEKIEEHCEESIRRTTEEQIEESAGAVIEDVENAVSGGTSTGDAVPGGMSDGALDKLAGLEMQLPEQVLEKIIDSTSEAADEFFESSGIYTQISQGMADFILDGISFFIALAAACLLSAIISRVLGIVSKIPILSGVNRFLGLFAGIINGLLIVWVAFYFIALCSSSELGTALVSYIYESEFLTALYENNLVLTLIMKFL